MTLFIFDESLLEIVESPNYRLAPTRYRPYYDFIHNDDESTDPNAIFHEVKLFVKEQLYKNVLLCGVGIQTGMQRQKAIINGTALLVCCADKLFCMEIEDLRLKWFTKADQTTVYGVYQSADAYFTVGEFFFTKIGLHGTILWKQNISEMIPYGKSNLNQIIMHDDFIELIDKDLKAYRLEFNGSIHKLPDSTSITPLQLENSKQKKWWKLF